ncbi:argininosuccinate synthase, chloroplastic-like [Miscanthus floridulus]|uniref:argininosuccinate synthase, chloroplastic-like n=1 Tax=Miscanthus floridulus TaxID=154761 RepID=UPI00345A120C
MAIERGGEVNLGGHWPRLTSAVVAPVEEDLDALAVDADEHLVRVDLAASKSYAFGRLDRCLKVSLLEEHVGELISLEEHVGEPISQREDLREELLERGDCNIHVGVIQILAKKIYIPVTLLTGFANFHLPGETFLINSLTYLEIGIVAGVPVSINGHSLSPASLLADLNEIGGKHGIGRGPLSSLIGRIDMVENRLVGMKSRGVYKTAGGTLMAAAVRELEALTLDRETTRWKDMVALKYAELVYAGRWFDPLRQSLETLPATITSSVTLKLYRGSASVASRKSPFSLYREDISSFENGEIYNQTDANGFIRLYAGGGHLVLF